MTKSKSDPGYESWKSNILTKGSLGDEDCRQVIAGFLEAAKKKPAVKVRPEKLKEQLSRTNELAKQYMLTVRSIRFVNNAQTLLAGSTSQCCNSCNAPVYSYHLLQSEKLKQAQPDESAVGLPGTKAKAVIDLLAKIRDADEQAILFVQYAEQIDDMEAACAASGIRSVCVRENSSASSQVTKFQTEKDARTRATVIILNGSDSSAAGVNLTNANHVLFFSPLLTDSQYSYDAAMAQAIGRVRRPGQTKDIQVYRFVALDTIDVDILEHRERRADALSELGADAISVKIGTSQGSEEEPTVKVRGTHAERTQLIRDTKGVFRLMPKSWLVGQNVDLGMTGIEGRVRVTGYEDFSSLVKFSKAYSEDD
ncbi:P-loop containing nucleoside triphosphate hydrolase protein [Elsinoe ampelina]|uniref:P-loop containing nucleoside triphosphate hydrolase protein n=1 Tax=Elsinoe ampelina TaxID=302913 RepID=A0A6A6FYN7_9PEZI|nr:P-loop containing nucleoside triphosphate hydrolase protein [Elsinoe ampelina]